MMGSWYGHRESLVDDSAFGLVLVERLDLDCITISLEKGLAKDSRRTLPDCTGPTMRSAWTVAVYLPDMMWYGG